MNAEHVEGFMYLPFYYFNRFAFFLAPLSAVCICVLSSSWGQDAKTGSGRSPVTSPDLSPHYFCRDYPLRSDTRLAPFYAVHFVLCVNMYGVYGALSRKSICNAK